MELHDIRSHHSTKDLTLSLSRDREGNLVEVKGRGFRHVNIYELINSKKRKPKCWIEDSNRTILWEASRRWRGEFEPVLTYRDAVHPKARVVVWDDEEGFILWDEPMTVISRRKK